MSVESCKEDKGPSGGLEVKKKGTHYPSVPLKKKILAAPNLVGKLINLFFLKGFYFLCLSRLDKLLAVTTNVLFGLSRACRSRVSPGIPLRTADL